MEHAARFEKYLTASDGALLHVLSEGEGRPVVLVHGWGADLTCFDAAARLISRGARCVRYDQRGHGSSRAAGGAPTIARLAEDLLGVLDGLALRDAVVAGHSMGGLALYCYFANYGMHALGAAAIMDMSPKPLCSPGWTGGMQMAPESPEGSAEFLTQTAVDAGMRVFGPAAAWMTAMGAMFAPTAGAATKTGLWLDMLNADYRDAIRSVTVPLAYFLPEKGIYPRSAAAFLSENAGGPFRLVRLPGRDHMTMLEEGGVIAKTLLTL
jgi:pimeloyl-ACP methyl ester carboxylesterase